MNKIRNFLNSDAIDFKFGVYFNSYDSDINFSIHFNQKWKHVLVEAAVTAGCIIWGTHVIKSK